MVEWKEGYNRRCLAIVSPWIIGIEEVVQILDKLYIIDFSKSNTEIPIGRWIDLTHSVTCVKM